MRSHLSRSPQSLARQGAFAMVVALLFSALPLSPVSRATATVPPSISVTPDEFGSGTHVHVVGANFTPVTAIDVWFDTNDDGVRDPAEPMAATTTSTSGTLAVTFVVKSAPGYYHIVAGSPTPLAFSQIVKVQSCWFDDCFIDDVDTVCILGTSPTESFLGLLDPRFGSVAADCKQLDSNFTDPSHHPPDGGYDLSVRGARFAGAGLLASMTNDLGLCARGVPCLVPGPHLLAPGSGCFAMNAAIVAAVAGGAGVPNVLNDPFNADKGLVNIACGTPPFDAPPAFDFGTYVGLEELAGNSVPDKDPLGLILLAINGAALAADGVVPGTGTTLLLAAQGAIAQAAVAGAIACGHVNYYCDGSDITATSMGKPDVQAAHIPLPFAQPPIFKLSTDPTKPNACPAGVGRCWGGIIGWSQVKCTDLTMPVPVVQPDGTTRDQFPDGPPVNGVQNYTDVGPCERPIGGPYPMLAVPGSAGVDNSDPLRAPIRCATGKIIGLSIGFDGDVSFDINDGPNEHAPGPGIASLVNYHNFQAGPGGSEAPNGIDIEIPLLDPNANSTQAARNAGVLGRDDFLPQLNAMRTGMRATVCGHWVADMHQLWNELHPIISLTLLPPDTTPPAVSCGAPDSLWHAADVGIACTATDSDSGLAVPADANFSLVTSVPAGTETASALTNSHQVCDAAGNCATAGPLGPNKVDKKAPTIGAAGIITGGVAYTADTWTNQTVTVHYTCADGGSGLAGACPADQSFSTDGETASTSGTATDNVGHTATASFGPIRIDKTAPTITASANNADATIYAAGSWTNQTVTVRFSCADAGSGVALCATDQTFSAEGISASTIGSSLDNAGNTASATFGPIRIDKTAPTIVFGGNAGSYTVDQTILITCVANDALSGIATTSCPAVASGPATDFIGTTNPAITTRTATATDNAGNLTSASTTFTVSVTADGICRLAAGLKTANAICAQARSIENAPNDTAKAGKVAAFDDFLAAESDKSIPGALAELLSILAHLL